MNNLRFRITHQVDCRVDASPPQNGGDLIPIY